MTRKTLAIEVSRKLGVPLSTFDKVKKQALADVFVEVLVSAASLPSRTFWYQVIYNN